MFWVVIWILYACCVPWLECLSVPVRAFVNNFPAVKIYFVIICPRMVSNIWTTLVKFNIDGGGVLRVWTLTFLGFLLTSRHFAQPLGVYRFKYVSCETRIIHIEYRRSLVRIFIFHKLFRLSVYSLQRVDYNESDARFTITYTVYTCTMT
jgi:hypothetical protein